ncbi:MAG: hypothetical protein Q9203_006512 [Teloschistes exilis]
MSLIQQTLGPQAAAAPRGMNLMGLPYEARREIYQHTFFPGRVRYPAPEKGFEIMGNLNVPTSLLLVSKQVKAEVLELYFENAHIHLFINPRWVPREKMPYDDFSQKGAVFIPPATLIRYWSLHLEMIQRPAEEDATIASPDVLRRMVLLMGENRLIMKSLTTDSEGLLASTV